VDHIGNAILQIERASDAQIGNAERRGDALAHELAELLAAAALEDFREHPESRGWVIHKLTRHRPFETPGLETLEALLAIAPVALWIRRVGKSAYV